MSAGKGDTYRKVDSKKWFDNYGEIRWRSKQKQKGDKMRTEIRADKFGSSLNKWIYDEQVAGISVANIDCVVSHFSASGDDVKIIEYKHTNESDRVMQDEMLKRLADRLKMSNQMSSVKFGVYKIRGELSDDTVDVYNYMTLETKTMTKVELKLFLACKNSRDDFQLQ